jgi:hypothetical protein
MRKLTSDVYETQKAKITNEDVPGLFGSMFSKQAAIVFERRRTFDLADAAKADLFAIFVRQYHTILDLAGPRAGARNAPTTRPDITSIHVLIRSCHERYLAFWYLASEGIFSDASREEEATFKWLCYYHGGIVDTVRRNSLRSRLVDTSALADSIKSEVQARRKIFQEIRHHRIFNRLDEGTQRAIEHHGAWRIGNAEALSWRQLAEISPLNSAFAQYEYHLMSLYAHAGYAGIKADQQNDADIPGLLAYLYVLAACYISTLDSIVPGSDANFTSRELACFQELLDVAESWVALPPLPGLDESFAEPEE